MTIAVLVGVVDGLAQPAVYGEAALLPSRFTQAVCAGTAASGALTSLIRILTKVAFDNNKGGGKNESSAAGGTKALVAFFGASAVECAAAAALFACVLPKTRAARSLAAGHAEARASLLKNKEVEMAVVEPPLSSSTTAATSAEKSAPRRTATKEGNDDQEDASTDSSVAAESRGLAAASRHPPPSRRRVALHMWPCAAAMVVIYGVTISLFPAAFSDVQVDKSGWFFVGVAAMFNVCDLIGKSLPAFKVIAERGIPRPKRILFFACCRVVFVPALIFSARAPSTAAAAGLVSAVSALLGLSNGYLTVCAFMTASAGLHGRDAEDAGTATVFALIAGLVVGSAASFLFLLK